MCCGIKIYKIGREMGEDDGEGDSRGSPEWKTEIGR